LLLNRDHRFSCESTMSNLPRTNLFSNFIYIDSNFTVHINMGHVVIPPYFKRLFYRDVFGYEYFKKKKKNNNKRIKRKNSSFIFSAWLLFCPFFFSFTQNIFFFFFFFFLVYCAVHWFLAQWSHAFGNTKSTAHEQFALISTSKSISRARQIEHRFFFLQKSNIWSICFFRFLSFSLFQFKMP
jgi:hypothetical protein